MDFEKLTSVLRTVFKPILGESSFEAYDTNDTSTSGVLGIDTPTAGTLGYDNLAMGPFVVGETITGGTSLATAVILTVGGATLRINTISGTFQDNEQITGGTSGATADVDGTVTNFVFQAGETVTGGTSGATAVVTAAETGELVLNTISGTFQNNEVLTGGTSDAEYLADGTVKFIFEGNFNMLLADGADNAVLERICQTSGTVIETVTIFKGTSIRGSFTYFSLQSGIVYAYSK